MSNGPSRTNVNMVYLFQSMILFSQVLFYKIFAEEYGMKPSNSGGSTAAKILLYVYSVKRKQCVV